MFGFVKDKLVQMALNQLREKVMNANLEGIGVVREISFKNGRLMLNIVLEGLQDRPISIEADQIEIAPDESFVTVKSFKSDMPFVHNALNRFASGPFAIPDDKRTYIKMARGVLGL